ncbi:MAG TPA: D-erythronate dehydrogenase [Kiloniellales bacterium]|nr:D-erythronate dehydrogenase [Kiloniellales bacterium]
MRVVILGGGGFLGQKLAKALARDGTIAGEKIEALALFDRAAPPKPEAPFPVASIAGDIGRAKDVQQLVAPGTGLVFHLAAVVSAEAEENFDLGMRVNLNGTRHVLDACRALAKPARLVFTSSVAVYGGEVTRPVGDETIPNPQSSYGTQKAAGELLVNDYSRKGFVAGVSLRLPTVVVRPGRPNRAASTFASSIIREPLQSQEAVCPVDRETRMWIASPRVILRSLLHAAELEQSALGQNRSLLLPGIVVSVAEMVESLKRVGGPKAVDRIAWQKDERIAAIVDGWIADFVPQKALRLGFPRDRSMDEIVQAFVEDDRVLAA